MKTKILLFLLVVQILVSCSPTQKTTPDLTSEIPEFKEYFETLTKQSTEWEPDAYMYMVDIPIGRKNWMLSASFYSPTNNRESLEVLLELDGNLSIRKYGHEFGILQQEPILISQLEIGSRDALKILFAENTSSITALTEVCGSLILGRGSTIPNRPLLWILYYNECGSPFQSHSYLNPLTGKIVIP